MERQYQSTKFGKYPGLKLTPGQVSQKKIVIHIMEGKPLKKLKKELPWLNALQLGTIHYQLKKMRKKRNLETPELNY